MANIDELVQLRAIENMEIGGMLARRPFRKFYGREDAFVTLTDQMFIKLFRLSKELVRYIIQLLEPYLTRPSRKSALDIETKVLLTLHFYATGSFQTNIGYNIFVGVSQSSVSRAINEVTNAFNQHEVFNMWVHFPNSLRELQKTRQRFYTMHGLPGVIGTIDCTHVAIFPPRINDEIYPEHIYVNRKGYHSINVQLICDSKLTITNVNARFPGRTHDAYIWSQSAVRDSMINVTRTHPDFYLIGDSGYPLRPWLQTPIKDPPIGTPEYRYNRAFKSTRSTVERCNRVLKMRFRCLIKHRVLHYSPTVCSKIINACVILHNICIKYNMPDPEPEDGDNELDFGLIADEEYQEPNENHNPIGQNRDLIGGRNLQRKIVRNYFTVIIFFINIFSFALGYI